MVKKVEWQHKFTDLFDFPGRGIKRLICVQSESTLSYSTLLKWLEKDERVAKLYNPDLSHVQQYLFTTLKIEPTSKVEVEYDDDTARLIRITIINEDGVARPHLQFYTSTSLVIKSSRLGRAIKKIQMFHLKAMRRPYSKNFMIMF